MVPSQKLEFDGSVFSLFSSLGIICVGTTTGEIIVYQYTTQLTSKLLLIPNPRQTSNATISILLVNSVREEILVNPICDH